MRSLRLSFAACTFLTFVISPAAPGQDAPPVDGAALLKELHKLRETQTTQSKQLRQTALQQANSGAASVERAVALWEEAVRAVQFDGAPKENAGFREWKDKEGETLNHPLARNAARLFFAWLSLTIQRDAGAKVKDLLPQIIAYTKDLTVDQQAEDALEDSIKREKDSAPDTKRRGPQPQQRKATDDQVRKMHDHILNRPLAASPVVQWLRLGDFIDPEKWEKKPSDLDGIFTQIVLPELREQKDPRVLEYWDLKVKKEGEAAVKTRLAFDVEKFNSQRRPNLLWSRAEEMIALGQKNRAIGEMFNLIRANPQYLDIAAWVTRLEELLAPPAPAGSAAETPPK